MATLKESNKRSLRFLGGVLLILTGCIHKVSWKEYQEACKECQINATMNGSVSMEFLNFTKEELRAGVNVFVYDSSNKLTDKEYDTLHIDSASNNKSSGSFYFNKNGLRLQPVILKVQVSKFVYILSKFKYTAMIGTSGMGAQSTYCALDSVLVNNKKWINCKYGIEINKDSIY